MAGRRKDQKNEDLPSLAAEHGIPVPPKKMRRYLDPKVELTHGRLECGIICNRCGGLDTIPMGTTIKDLHSPDEQLFIPSLANTWEFLKKAIRG